MTTRIYIDPMTDEALLYQWDPEHRGWAPDIAAMAAWRTGDLRVYRPTATATNTFVTMPGHVRRPAMTDAELRDICGTASRPWIPVAAIPTVAETDIPSFDIWAYAPDPADDVPTTWESVAVPLLHYEANITPRFFPSYNQDDEAAVSALLTIRQEMLVPTAPPGGEQSTVQQSTQIQELPRHVATLVLERAITTGAICPISMEPIQPAGASVTGCGHVFQTAALRRWMADRDTCPECRSPTAATAF